MFVQIAQAAQQAAQEMKEPVLTWNLFVTGFGLPAGLLLLGNYIKHKIEAKAKVDHELELRKKEALETWQKNMEKTFSSWQEGAKERTAGICQKLDEIKKVIDKKRDSSVCDMIHEAAEKKHEDMERKVNHIENKVFFT